MQAILSSTRLLASPPPSVFSEQLSSLTEQELLTVEKLLATSAHNRQVCTVGETLNAALALLPKFEDEARRAIALRIIRHLGDHRFTVHNTRFVLAAVMRHLDNAVAATGTQSAAEASAALELLQLMGDVLIGSARSAAADLPSFWDMGVGVMGATGFDLPADQLVALVSRGSFSVSIWVRTRIDCASPLSPSPLVSHRLSPPLTASHRLSPSAAFCRLLSPCLTGGRGRHARARVAARAVAA